MSADDFREMALALEGAIEGAHMGHPDFRANGRIFASLDAAERMATVKLTPDEQRALMRSHPAVFTAAAGAWGRQGWTRVRLETADPATARSSILLAWQNVVERRRTGRAPSRRTVRRTPRRG